jgi:hypothetical protein
MSKWMIKEAESLAILGIKAARLLSKNLFLIIIALLNNV